MSNIWKALLALFLGIVFLAIVQGTQTPLIALSVLGDDAVGFSGIQEEDVRQLEAAYSEDELEDLREKMGPEVRAALDCSAAPPAERIPGVTCIEGLLYGDGRDWTPIPEDRWDLLPLWRAAEEKTGIQWEMLAAISAARSYFARVNCPGDFGDGPYRIQGKVEHWGESKISEDGFSCFRSEEPFRWKKRGSPGGDAFDWVDSTFTLSSKLAENKAGGEWDYNGDMKRCLHPASSGPLWTAPEKPTFFGEGAKFGYNKKLEIPRWAKSLAAKYRSDKGEYRPRRDTPDPNYSPMPKKDLIALLEASWKAFGVRPPELYDYVSKNYAQIGMESGGRPYILQGYIGDVNDNNPAGGLFQFIPSTFDHWNVDGFDDRFNPLDNILAAVNAQVNSGMGYILSGASGWSPPWVDNPYATGGRAKIVGKATMTRSENLDPYRGLPATDRNSLALEEVFAGGPCQTQIIYDWYKKIRDNPPDTAELLPGPSGTEKAVGGGELVPCPKKIPQDTYNACYVDKRIIPDLLWLHQEFKIYIQDGYSGPLPDGGAAGCFATGAQCHSVAGEHPLGIGIDIIPIPGESWDNIDRLARWAEPSQDQPKAPFRWVGYDGDYNHGSGHHLHLSWEHSTPTVPYQVADWVLVMKLDKRQKGDLAGRVSYFGGGSDLQPVAGGGMSDKAGVALNLKPGTDRGWNNDRTQKWMRWAREGNPMIVRVKTQGRSADLPIIDLGPAGWTGRAIDITEAGIRKMGFRKNEFETDAPGTVKFLGRKK